jgi:hypothetical protein
VEPFVQVSQSVLWPASRLHVSSTRVIVSRDQLVAVPLHEDPEGAPR